MWAALVATLAAAAGAIAIRVLLAVGFSVVTYYAVDSFITSTAVVVEGLLTGLPVVVVQLLGLAQVDKAVSILFAAMTGRLALVGLKALKFTGTA